MAICANETTGIILFTYLYIDLYMYTARIVEENTISVTQTFLSKATCVAYSDNKNNNDKLMRGWEGDFILVAE